MVLSRVLDEAGLEHEFVGPELQAPGAFAEIVEALVDRASRATGDDDHDRALFADVAVVDGDAVLLGPVVAGRGRRFLAFVVEALIFDLVLLATAGICLVFFLATLGLAVAVSGAERQKTVAVPAE